MQTYLHVYTRVGLAKAINEDCSMASPEKAQLKYSTRGLIKQSLLNLSPAL